MRLSLPKTVTPQQIAICLGIGERAVRQQAAKGHWPKIHQKGRGGASIAFVVSGLPDHIRTAMIAKLPPAHGCAGSRAGCARANDLTQEAKAAAIARRQAKEQGLAAYERLPEEKKRQANARRQILNARDAFITASGLSKKQATSLFIREYQAGAIGLETWVTQALNAKLSWPTLYRWERAYQESGMAGLANGYEATRHTAIVGHMQDFIMGLLCAQPHLGIPMVRQAVEARFAGQAIPSTSALRRFVANWRQENKSLIQFVTSPDQWRNHHMIALADVQAFVELSAEKYDVKMGGHKGNVTLTSFDGKYKVQVAVGDRIAFDERLQAAKKLIDECLTDWTGDSRDEVKTIVMDAFQVDKEGGINTGRILALRRLSIDDERWHKAQEAIADSIQVVGSKTYIRFYERSGPDDRFVPIALDMAVL